MLSHPTRIETASSFSRRAVHPTRGALLAAGAALVLIPLGTRLVSPPVEAAPAAAVIAGTGVSSAPTAISATGCWVTGDLVGEGNPVDLATALCGHK